MSLPYIDCYIENKANLRDLMAATSLVILFKLVSNHWFFILYDLEIGWPPKAIGHLFCTTLSFEALCIISKPSVNSNWSCNIETPNSGQNWQFFVPCDLQIWRMTLKNNKVLLLCYFKLCASFHSHQSIQTGVTIWKCQIQVKISDFLSHVTLNFDGWPWKTIGHLI